MKTTPFYFFTAVIISALGSASADDEKHVTCGSAIKLTHVESGGKYLLQSDERQLQSGSGQQLVTAAENNRSPNGLWQVREGTDENTCEVGTPVKCGQVIRLMHIGTGSNLHTHGIRSPLSNQHEVTGFGQEGKGDAGDDWKVVCEGGSYFGGANEYWNRDKPIQFVSVGSNRYLGSSSTVKFTEQNCGRGCPILNHLEVFARSTNDSYSHW
eukprot:CAMPEP_0201882296 /NCGR_PEP_ID=MMETSP0902-20130614/13593_1 /ASSEMBLY_ACC=CAM_ASM_000551 /TAXON_ID=420261 /ORGANISM="Thalassiosira antarctica, Strain CCMP982" /LENGTH=211 /DNA_ID=CAMNT_0048410753 /DNA_START=74 /DNA_END=706 /DNA_ORIENTATION=+